MYRQQNIYLLHHPDNMRSTRRFTVFTAILLGLLLVITACSDKKSNPEFSFAVITDCQYDRIEGTGIRKYSMSENKLRECVAHLNKMNLEFVIHLGDFIDKNFNNFDVVEPIYKQLTVPGYHVLGNHDFSVEDNKKSMVYHKLGMPSRYYDFAIKGWRFIVLDGNDISFHAWPGKSKKYLIAEEYYKQNRINSPKWNGAIGKKQFSWLEVILKKTEKSGEKVVLFCHFPVFPSNTHNLWNAHEMIDMIDQYPNVKMYVNGHNHAGHYGMHKGVHYLTLKGMVDTNETAYSIFKISENTIEVSGYGREMNRILKIK